MPPLTRQPTRQSILSWWSDSNPTGPNINLHAIAKPLMRLMYHRDVLALIKKSRGIPLSMETMEIYSSYLAFKYVSSSTKTAILEDLEKRTKFGGDARTVAESPVLDLVSELLRSSDPEVQSGTRSMLEQLAHHAAALGVNPCVQLVSLLCDKNPKVIVDTVFALYRITQRADGAQAAVDAKILDCVAELFASLESVVRRWTCKMLGNLVFHETTARTVCDLNLCIQLVSLLRDKNPDVIGEAVSTLGQIALRADGAQAAVEAKILDCVAELLASPDYVVWTDTWEILRRLASHKTAATCVQLVSLLRDKNPKVVEEVLTRLWQITEQVGGAQAAVDANILDCVAELLASPNQYVRRFTCMMLLNLASHEITVTAVLNVKPCFQLVSVLCDKNCAAHYFAVGALRQIARRGDGAQAVVDAMRASPDPLGMSFMSQIFSPENQDPAVQVGHELYKEVGSRISA
ncbi:armadillo-type protein [Mycena galopus ATCC 62051]|nr:armadillo-type protein [Mycena galopus ATCC 62051]KAF8192000.1 armadillo-type protein [Mycena galopus ATCC 62051]